MPTLDYSVVDVFTAEPLAGNPLAVVMNTCGLTTEQMQAIAREFNLSETTFVERRAEAIERAEGVRVRIFTTREELQLCRPSDAGHGERSEDARAGNGAARHGDAGRECGPVPVRFEAGASGSTGFFGEMTQRDPEFGAELDRAIVARLAGLAAGRS